ncbi:MAG: VWA domain-containing protein [Marinifilaceae bacterium]|jgi:Ca-activated chloride channel family protein
MSNIDFANPGYLFLLLLIIPMIVWYVLKDVNSQAEIKISSIDAFKNIKKSPKIYLRHALFVLRLMAMSLLIFVLARPQSSVSWKETNTEGIDIVLAMDISSSMLAQDFSPNRLEAAKDVASDFVLGRENDRIGLVVFAGESFTQCPLTTDHAVLVNLFKDIKAGMVEDGTAIGLGLANSINRLKDSKAKSKVVILLTDGVNNRGEIAPETAAELANTFGIRVYTVGVGTKGNAPYPVQTAFGIQMQSMPVEIDEVILNKIADETGGKYFRATSKNKLEDIYTEINKLEKTKIEVKNFSKKNEMYLSFGVLALLLLLLELILRYTVLRIIP